VVLVGAEAVKAGAGVVLATLEVLRGFLVIEVENLVRVLLFLKTC
jgi:hypothetical protein